MCYWEAGCCVKVLKATVPDGIMKKKKKSSASLIHPPLDGHPRGNTCVITSVQLSAEGMKDKIQLRVLSRTLLLFELMQIHLH